MANRPAPGLVIGDVDRVELERWTRSSSVSAGLAQRARIVLLAGQGVANSQIATRVGVSVSSPVLPGQWAPVEWGEQIG